VVDGPVGERHGRGQATARRPRVVLGRLVTAGTDSTAHDEGRDGGAGLTDAVSSFDIGVLGALDG
jgi:hypothetical protein